MPIDKPNVQAITTRIPIGVIAAIVPWNSQMFLTATKLAPALAMGNTVVIKSSELAPAVMFEFANSNITAGASSDDLITTVFPIARAGASLVAVKNICEFHGTIAAITPIGILVVIA